MAAQVVFGFTNLVPNIATALQLNSPAGLMLSQVVTLCVDNTLNPSAVTVVHGALNETNIVPAYGYSIIPTFSNKSSFPINLACVTTPNANTQTTITFLNYQRQSASFVNNGQSNVNATGVFSNILTSQTFLLTGTANITLLNSANVVLTALDLAVESLNATAAGRVTATLAITTTFAPLVTFDGIAVATAAGNIPGGSSSPPVNLSWPEGLYLQRGAPTNLLCSAFTNLVNAGVRVNMYGYFVA